jgi:hypothetical protein
LKKPNKKGLRKFALCAHTNRKDHPPAPSVHADLPKATIDNRYIKDIIYKTEIIKLPAACKSESS